MALVPAASSGAGPLGTAPVDDRAWRVAYAITGDRAVAYEIAADAAIDTAADPLGVTLLVTAARLAMARAAAAERTASQTAGQREALWTVLRQLPRRDRAAIVARLRPR